MVEKEEKIVSMADASKGSNLKELSSHILGKPATMEEVWLGKAKCCWTCSNSECKLSKQDVLMKCTCHIKHSGEDMELNTHNYEEIS